MSPKNMINFRIIPVIDILNSIAVHANKGERDKYKPLRSEILNTTNPIEIIKILSESFHFNEMYIADLDAIIKKKPNYDFLSKLVNNPKFNILLDPGISDINDILNYSKFQISKLILGLETINNLNIIRECIDILGPDKTCVSIDMYKGKLITKLKNYKDKTPLALIKTLKELNVKEIILLDLFRVGQKVGGVSPLYLKIRKKFHGDILIGGGIKDFNDINMLYNHKFSGVLIGTALYDGSIKIEKLSKHN